MGVHRILAIVLCVGVIASCAKKNTNGGMGTGGGIAPFGTGGLGGLGTGGSNIVTGNPNAGNAAVGGNMIKPSGTGGMVAGTGGMMMAMGTGGMGTGGMGLAGRGMAGMGVAGMGTAGMGTAGMGTAGMGAGGGNTATGMLCTLGAVKPIVNAYITANSGETLIYLSTVPLTCAQMMTGGLGWLSSTTAGGQVIEIVIGALAGGTNPAVNMPINVGTLQGEVNFAPTGGPSAAETTAASGSITFTKFSAMGPAEGTFMASYGCGGMVMGTFKAEFCNGGQGY